MLCVNRYPKAYVDDCRARVDAQLSTYRALLKAARAGVGNEAGLASATERFEPPFFGHLVIALDAYFIAAAAPSSRRTATQ